MRILSYSLGLVLLIVLPFVFAVFMQGSRPTGLQFTPVPFAEMEAWHTGEVTGALPALGRSCRKLRSLPVARRLPGASLGGTVGDWLAVCDKLPEREGLTEASARRYFEENFTPQKVSVKGDPFGKFTGYYEPLLEGSLEKSDVYQTPIMARPGDLVMVDLGQFRADLKGRRIAGSIKNGRLIPYPDRKMILEGDIAQRATPLLYVDDPVDAFFLHIQGSGRVRLPDGSLQMVGYAAQNGHAYTSVGRVMIREGLIGRENMSMQAIRSWFAANPERAHAVMNKNRSYVFFRFLEGSDGPFGSAGVPLTAGHSLAVDRRHLALHMPLWLSTSHPDPDNRAADPLPMNRMMVAQDTGGAITGEVRGDVFWGFGDEAEEIAGRMANRGRYWVLLPKPLSERQQGRGR